MKFTLSWLLEHLETDASCKEITDCLTKIGLELEEIEDPADIFRGFVVGHVVEASQHPDADRLRVLKVDVGQPTLKTVVCGAPNAQAGLIGILAQPGCVIPSTGAVLGKGKIRGIESEGMMCSGRELGLSDDHEGIIALDHATAGADAAQALGQVDPVIDIAITPNRPDALGIRGIARDLAAAGLGTLKPLPMPELHPDDQLVVDHGIDLEEEAAWRCPYFVARRFSDVNNPSSPQWLQTKLKSIGLRPISTLVDITNYFTMTFARPLHVFDADKLKGRLHVRLAQEGESLLALDEKTYVLTAEDLVIADDRGPVAIAGVMGGMETGCSEDTKNVILETAYFDPVGVARTGRRLNILSDARFRFERGIDPVFTKQGDMLATAMIQELCGGVYGPAASAGDAPKAPSPISYSPSMLKRLTGMDVAHEVQKKLLEDLGFVVEQQDIWQIQRPSWRPDVHGAADIVEEITRLIGLDDLPLTPLPNLQASMRPVLTARQRRQRLLRHCAAGLGLREAVTWSFLRQEEAEIFGGGKANMRLDNPISSELSDMRPSLVPNLVQALARNHDRGFRNLGLFELGPVYQSREIEGQRDYLTAVMVGNKAPAVWHAESRPFDVFDAKGMLFHLLTQLGVQVHNLLLKREAPDTYHPGRYGALFLGPNNKIAQFGELHPKVAADFGLNQPVVVFEIDIDAVPFKKTKGKGRPQPEWFDLQAVEKDLAFVVDENIEAQSVVHAARGANKKLIHDVQLFDLFRGGDLLEGQKSLAIRLTLQPSEKSLTDAEIADIIQQVASHVQKATGGVLRG